MTDRGSVQYIFERSCPNWGFLLLFSRLREFIGRKRGVIMRVLLIRIFRAGFWQPKYILFVLIWSNVKFQRSLDPMCHVATHHTIAVIYVIGCICSGVGNCPQGAETWLSQPPWAMTFPVKFLAQHLPSSNKQQISLVINFWDTGLSWHWYVLLWPFTEDLHSRISSDCI